MTDDGREGGYVRSYRSVESSADFAGLRADQCWVAHRIVQLANWKPGIFTVERGNHRHVVEVARGELAMSEETIAKRSKVGRQVARTTIHRLLESGFLSARSTQPPGQSLRRPVRILRVVNYDKFNPPTEDTTNKPTNHSTSPQPVPNQSLTWIEEGEEREEGKQQPPPEVVLPSALPYPEDSAEKRWPLTSQFRDRLASVQGLTAPPWSWPKPENRDHLEYLLAKISLGVAVPAAAAELKQAASEGYRIRSVGHFLGPLERLNGSGSGSLRTGSAAPASHEAFGAGGESAID